MAKVKRGKNRAAETRASVEDPTTPITTQRLIEIIGMESISSAGVTVNIEAALTVPAVWAAVNFISGTIAGLPLETFKRSGEGRKKLTGRLARILHDAVNEEMSSFSWRKYSFERLLTGGRSLTLIVRGKREPVRYLWPLDPSRVRMKMLEDGRRQYEVATGIHQGVYSARDIIDLHFALKSNGLDHYSPILRNRDTIGLAIAATLWGSKFFKNGGVPPFALTGKFTTGAGLRRASEELKTVVQQAAKENRLALTLPEGHELKQLGTDPSKSQLVELKKFLIEEVARIYSLPPVFLQDLSHGTFNNSEQQDLHFVKHTIKRWVEQFEQELNLKLFGWDSNRRYCEFNLDGLLRGDFKTRMDGNARAIQNALLTPNEARRRENLPDMPSGNDLLIQGATVPLGSQPIADSQGDSNDDSPDDGNSGDPPWPSVRIPER